MGGFRARIAAITAALFALALGPAQAAAEGPLEAASSVQAVQQRVAEVADPVLQQAAPATAALPSAPAPGQIREAAAPAGRAASPQRTEPPAGGDGPASAARPMSARRDAPRVVPERTEPRATRPATERRDAVRRPADRQRAERRSATSRRVAAPAAPSPASHDAAAAPVPSEAPSDTGTAAGPRALAVPGSFLFAAALVVLLGAARPRCLRPLRAPSPALRRLAFVSPSVPPG